MKLKGSIGWTKLKNRFTFLFFFLNNGAYLLFFFLAFESWHLDISPAFSVYNFQLPSTPVVIPTSEIIIGVWDQLSNGETHSPPVEQGDSWTKWNKLNEAITPCYKTNTFTFVFVHPYLQHFYSPLGSQSILPILPVWLPFLWVHPDICLLCPLHLSIPQSC